MSTPKLVDFNMTIQINDEAAFRQAAYMRAKTDGCSEEEARYYLDADHMSLGDCAVMLCDPGMTPESSGASILNSTGEMY